MPKTAEIFNYNGHRAVRLPDDVHLSGDHVKVRQDSDTGDIILSPQREAQRHASWEELFRLLDEFGPIEEDFLSDRDRTPPREIV